MSDLFPIALGFHIAAGAIALLIAPLAMMTTKGGLWHRRWGKIYFWAMAAVALTATVMCVLRSGLFLFLIAIFSFYLALTGYTVLRRKRPEDRPGALDWGAALAMLAAGTALVISGAADAGDLRWVRVVFGLIGLLLSGSDIRCFLKGPADARAWWFRHMTRFLGAYIATVTAFSVVNFKFLPDLWRWMWPTLIGLVGIYVWRSYYRKKFQRQAAAD